jgi:hypothetical protein
MARLTLREKKLIATAIGVSLNAAAEYVGDMFRDLAFDEKTHIGLGDVRVTKGMQEDIIDTIKRLNICIRGEKIVDNRQKEEEGDD